MDVTVAREQRGLAGRRLGEVSRRSRASLHAGLILLLAGGLAPPASAREKSYDYTGAGSCASSNCHGSLRPRAENRIPQNEHTVWATRDAHAQGYAHLLTDRSKIIARNLRLSGSPQNEPRCLDCHALNVPEARRGRSFDLADGVGCEACHGPASEWLGEHTTRGWTHAQSVALGMRDTKDPLVRAETCAACHVGSAGRAVDHELYAAGHPELVFEMEWASASMPRHWREPAERGAFHATRLWAVGQAVMLREQMARAGRARAGAWPEYGEFDCGACHHELTQESWRRARGYEGRRPGEPAFDLSRWRVLASLVRLVEPGIAEAMEAKAREVASTGAQFNATALDLSRQADALARRLDDPTLDLGRGVTTAAVRAMASDTALPRDLGYRGAGQSAMSLDSLTRALLESAGPRGRDLDGAVAKLFAVLKEPAAYDPDAYVAALQALSTRLRELEAAPASR